MDFLQTIFEYGFYCGRRYERRARSVPCTGCISAALQDVLAEQINDEALEENRPVSIRLWEVIEKQRSAARDALKRVAAQDWELEHHDIEECTCSDCPAAAFGCEFAFDFWNTNGDCLAEK